MKTIQQALLFVSKSFQSHQIDLPTRHAENLLADLLNYSRQTLYLNRDQLLTDEQWLKCQQWLSKRVQGMPLQYLHGEVEFYNCTIEVNPHVLIPRQETEILVDKIVQVLKKNDLKDRLLWDLCCGSGCIAIALKKQFPLLQVIASDLSPEAVKTAERNSSKNQVEILVKQGDLLQAFENRKVHYFVCNPPYISSKEFQQLEKGVLDYEPHQALLAGETGLEFYKRLAEQLPTCLSPFADVWLEIGYNQGQEVSCLFGDRYWINQRVEKDWAGHDRFFSCQLK